MLRTSIPPRPGLSRGAFPPQSLRILDMLTVEKYTVDNSMVFFAQSPSKEVGIKVHKLACLLDRLAADTLSEKIGLTFSQFRILMVLKRHGEFSQKKIATFHGLTEAAISRQIDILLKKGLLERSENKENRREHILKLTSQGRQFGERAAAALENRFDAIFSKLPEKEREGFHQGLEMLLTQVESFYSSRAHTKSKL